MAQVELVALRKEFGKAVVAVNDLDLTIPDNGFIALLGPSGCGKTTILLMIAGIYVPTKGEILFDGVRVNEVEPKDRYVGLVFQSYALYPHMTVYQNISFPLRLAKRPKAEIDDRVRKVAGLTRIEQLLERRPGQLSGGQQQRVALCRALVKETEVLLLDEPLSNLDARLRIETRAEIKRLQQELGITTILVTHDQIEAMSMAERVAVLHEGVLQQYTTPEELYNRPRNLFVASFIGDPPMNLAPVRYQVENSQPKLVANGLEVPLSPEWAQRVEQTGASEPTLGIRPEEVVLSREAQNGAFRGEVILTEPLGGGVLVHFRFGGSAFRVVAPHGFSAAIGEQLWLAPQKDKLHLFLPSGESVLLASDASCFRGPSVRPSACAYPLSGRTGAVSTAVDRVSPRLV
ncbi:MAG: Trehalose import ATP-binding protein SugC [Chloroflexi bacterium]|nr:Trehalose import ATP-binding protein SugC [Chloroflexota bacterium]